MWDSNKPPKLQAFFLLLQWAEGTLQAQDPFRVCFGYKHTILSFEEHPALSGEWQGERLPAKFCRAAGIIPPCRSTAAGAFQITKSTWQRLRKKAAKLLPDFSPTSQERAACILLEECGAMADLLAGNVALAMHKASRLWASLPGSTSKQPQRTKEKALAKFDAFLVEVSK